MPSPAEILDLLADVTEHPAVRTDLDLPLFDRQVLDSLRTIEFIVALSRDYGIEVSPAELERDEWATPRQIVAFVTAKASG